MAQTIKPNLLVIGGTGFIGYHLLRAAKKKNWKISSISLNKPKKHRYVRGINYIIADIGNLKKLKKKLNRSFTYVVNLGGYVDHSFSKRGSNEIIKTHFIGLINLIKILSKKKIKSFVQIGSSAEYGKNKPPQNENQRCLPNSDYGLAKLASTEFLLMLYKIRKFPATILRLFQVYGPKQDSNRVLPQIIKGCLNNEKFPVSRGDQIRDFCYIDDVVNAIFLALTSKKSNGRIFNIGSGKPKKIKQVIKQVCRIIGQGKPQFGKIKYRKDENMKVYPIINKAHTELKWKPKIDFDKGIKIVINSFRKIND